VLSGGVPAEAIAGQAELNASSEAAFTSFWLNRTPAVPEGEAPGPGLQDHYIGAMAALARRFRNNSTVVGYEIMNEPLSGFIPPVAFTTTSLFPFYSRVISALTGVGSSYRDLGVDVRRQSFFFEPMAIRNLEDAPDQLPLAFTTYPNLVYAPHTYTHVFTLDRTAGLPPQESPYPLSYNQAYVVADLEARALNAALISGEYGNSAGEDSVTLAHETAAQDTALVGSTIYAWKGVCGAGSSLSRCENAWSVYAGDPATPPAQNLGLIPSRVKYLSRVYPRATAGTLEGMSYDPDTGAFTMTAAAPRVGAPTEVFIPAAVRRAVRVSGAARLVGVVTEPDGTRLASVAPTGHGSYRVSL
jgi:endoglycosylceramidase